MEDLRYPHHCCSPQGDRPRIESRTDHTTGRRANYIVSCATPRLAIQDLNYYIIDVICSTFYLVYILWIMAVMTIWQAGAKRQLYANSRIVQYTRNTRTYFQYVVNKNKNLRIQRVQTFYSNDWYNIDKLSNQGCNENWENKNRGKFKKKVNYLNYIIFLSFKEYNLLLKWVHKM